jgi:hypothetical protein
VRLRREIAKIAKPPVETSERYGKIRLVESRKIAKEKRKWRCYANALTTRSRILLKGDEGGEKIWRAGDERAQVTLALWFQLGRHETEELARK